MADRVVSVRLEAETRGFTAGLHKAKASVDDLTKASKVSGKEAFEKLADKAALAGVGIAAGIGVAVKRFADFDSAMSAVRANSGATGAELDALRASAIKLGADSQFSATEAAQGINELAKAGVRSADILGGGLKGSLDLAAAGQIGVAEAAETAATAMTQFNLSGDKVPHIADLLTNAANKAQGGVGDMGAALKQAGLVAASTGLSIEETTAGLTAFASAGLLGSDAGTSFKTMLQRLSAPTNEAQGLMDELGISAYDSQGNFVGLSKVAGQLQTALGDLTPEQRNSALATIFGSDAVRAANVLYKEGAAGIDKWTKEVSEQGAAAKQAAILTDNLKGDIERLGGALDSVFIQGGAPANSSLRTLVQGVTGLVDWIGKIPGPLLLAGGGLASFALLAPKGVIAWRKYTAQLDTLGLSFDKISAKAPRTARGLQMVGRAAGLLGIAATAVYAFGGAVDRLNAEKLGVDLAGTADGLGLINKELAAQTSNGWGRVGSDIDSFGKILGATFDPGVVNNIDNAIGGLKTVFGGENVSNMANAAKQLAGIDQAMASLVAGGNGEQAAATFDQMAKVAAAQGISVEQLQRKLPQYATALAQAGSQATTTATDTGTMTTATDDLETAAADAEQALKDLHDAILGLGSPVAEQRQATRDYEAAIDDAAAAVKENGKTLDTHTEKGRANASALDALRGSILDKVNADFEATRSTKGIDAATATATKTMEAGRRKFIEAATAAGMTKKEAEKLATQLGLVPKDVAIKVSQTGAKAAEDAIKDAAKDRNATIWVTTKATDSGTRVLVGGVSRGHFAGGGAIRGLGGPTADTVPAMLSPGEHVMTAAEVSKLGGQAAVYSLRSMIRAGWKPQGFATGGAVSSMPSFVSAPRAPLDVAALVAALRSGGQVQGGPAFTINALDPGAIVREVVAELDWRATR